MHTFKTWQGKAKKILICLLFLTPSVYAQQQAPSKEQETKQIENVVKDYLMKHPEVIIDALENRARADQQERSKQAQEKISQYHADLFQNKDDPILGDPKGQLSMVIFMDPYCSFCRRYQKILDEVRQKYPFLKIIYKVLPVLGQESLKTAREEIAANLQGKFTDYHDALYESSAQDRDHRMDLAQGAGLNVDKLKEDVKSQKVREIIQNNKSLAKVLGINGTPVSIIGNEFVEGYLENDQLSAKLEALKSNKTNN